MNPAQAAYKTLKILEEYIEILHRKCQSIRENTMDLLSFHQTPEIKKAAEDANKMMEENYREINKLQDEIVRLARSV